MATPDTRDAAIHLHDLGHQGEVDVTLLARMLRLSPLERLRFHERWRRWLQRRSPTMAPFMEEIVRRLTDANVEFVVVGGVSAVLQGAGVVTLDLDLCYRRTEENIARLVGALAPLKPRPRGFPADLPFIFDARTVQLG